MVCPDTVWSDGRGGGALKYAMSGEDAIFGTVPCRGGLESVSETGSLHARLGNMYGG